MEKSIIILIAVLAACWLIFRFSRKLKKGAGSGGCDCGCGCCGSCGGKKLKGENLEMK